MPADPTILAAVGACIGLLVGLTGVGGGALMTPVLVLLGVDPLTAVSSDLVVSLVMKPVGSAVHARRGTINTKIVRWLALGSVPSAFLAAASLERIAGASAAAPALKKMLGGALLVASVAMMVRSVVSARRTEHIESVDHQHMSSVRVLPTVLLGVVGGVIVGLTSVGSGSVMIVGLMLLYPRQSQRTLVGTDLAQAIPLVASAALGHALFGRVDFALALPLIIGAIPAVFIGARLSATDSFPLARPLVLVVLLATASQLLGATPPLVGCVALLAGIATLVTHRGASTRAAQ